jgi:hypothetical protein
MITIEQPALVLNAVTNPQIARYQMWNTGDVHSNKPSQEVIGWIRIIAGGAPGGKLKNVIIQCHGAPGYLAIGQGFTRTNVGLFQGVAGLVDKIWVVACQPAYIDPTCGTRFCSSDGNLFISEMARAAHCYVVAPTETQINRGMTYPFGVIPSYEGLVLSYGPGGDVTWSHRYPSGWQGE